MVIDTFTDKISVCTNEWLCYSLFMSPAATNFEYANNTHVLCIFSVTDVKLLWLVLCYIITGGPWVIWLTNSLPYRYICNTFDFVLDLSFTDLYVPGSAYASFASSLDSPVFIEVTLRKGSHASNDSYSLIYFYWTLKLVLKWFFGLLNFLILLILYPIVFKFRWIAHFPLVLLKFNTTGIDNTYMWKILSSFKGYSKGFIQCYVYIKKMYCLRNLF